MEIEWTTVLDNIDDIVIVINNVGRVEKLNKSFHRITGIDTSYEGALVQNLVSQKIQDNSLVLKILEEKKPMNMNISYYNGCVITYSGIPTFYNGQLQKVIVTGRDLKKLKDIELFLQNEKLHPANKSNEVVYASKKMQDIVNMSIKAAKSNSSILIWGESGVGKEVIANLIHNSSERRLMPFIDINCAAIPAELMESELFGYEEGTFTGAKKGGKLGLLEKSNGGTLFLDEIGIMPSALQSKLLRVFQEKYFRRIGGTRNIHLDTRLISATNLNKKQLLDNNCFRQDLLYRLAIISIFIPPLRERKEDIPPLIYHYLQQFNQIYGKNIKLSQQLLIKLYNHYWPGNIRQLKNYIERLIILCDDNNIEDVYFDILDQFGDYDQLSNEEITVLGLMPLKLAFAKLENILISKAYTEFGSIIKTAEVLQIDPSTIHRKIKKGLLNL